MEKECKCLPIDTQGKSCDGCIHNALIKLESLYNNAHKSDNEKLEKAHKEICKTFGNDKDLLEKANYIAERAKLKFSVASDS
jgi:hypothetical protein